MFKVNGVFIVNFEHISCLFLVLLILACIIVRWNSKYVFKVEVKILAQGPLMLF